MKLDVNRGPKVSEHLKWIVAGPLVLVLLGLPMLPLPELSTPGWFAWLGRLHPLLVHFPAALVPLLVVFEGIFNWKKAAHSALARRLFWIAALAGTVASTTAGYLLYASGDYGGELAREHFWGAVATTAFLAIAALFSPVFKEARTGFIRYDAGFLGLALLGVLYTGHHGGMLTHGAGFLADAAPVKASYSERLDGPRDELRVLDDLILPAFELRCVSCHNADKKKGDLQLTSFQTIRAGGESGEELLAAGDVSSSELHRRITLPREDDDYMPPDGKPALSEVEIDLIAWWIEQGATPDMLYGAGPSDSSREARFDRYLTKQMQVWRRRLARKQDALEAAASLKEDIEAFEVDVDPESAGVSLAVSMKIPPAYVDDDTVAGLVEYDRYITSLSLVGSEITDDALYHIGRLPSLRSLYLAYNAIDGSGLVYLQNAPDLERLNLSRTSLSSEAALHLTRMPALKQVYLFDTPVDSVMIDALREFLPGVEISVEEGPLHHGV